MPTKQELVDFLFWLQYKEQGELLKQWIGANASNRYVAQKYINDANEEGRGQASNIK